MSLKIVQAENGFTITKIEFQQKQEIWVCSTVGELAEFLLGYYKENKENLNEED